MKTKKDIIKKLQDKYKGKKVLVWGLGLHGGGIGTARFFAKLGSEVLVTDTKTEHELGSAIKKLNKYKDIKYHLGGHKEEDFRGADFVIRNPAVKEDNRFLEIAKKAGVKVENDVGIFFENSPAFKIGITGTKGKSTVTALLYDLVKQQIEKDRIKFFVNHDQVFLGGNIRKSVFDCLEQADERSVVVLELSSAQLEHASYAKISPDIAVITNIYPEHISFHFSYDKYLDAKKKIFEYQSKKDLLIINKEQKELVKGAQSKILFTDGSNHDVLKKFASIFKIPEPEIRKVLRDFKGLEGRLEFVKELKGIKFVNDTCATHPLAISFALGVIKKPILVMGGIDKGFGSEVEDLARTIVTRKIITVVLPGTFSDKIKEKFSNEYKKSYLHDAASMNEAVNKAYSLAKRGDTVLLSPGGSSFNLFINEFDRGSQFVKEVKRLK